MFKEVLTKLPAESADLHECIKFFTSTALDQYLHSCEEDVMDTDISNEFHRESHHIHEIPRPRISQVSKFSYLPFSPIFILLYSQLSPNRLSPELESENEMCCPVLYNRKYKNVV